jgi:hypothetical protein
VNIKNLHKALPYLFKAKITPLLIGPKGVGKSEAVRQYADSNDLQFIDLRLGQMADAGDLLGLLDFVKDAKGNTIASRHMKPAFFPTSGKGILFLDELNRATRDVQQAVFQLVLDGRIHEYQLPEGWTVIAAANPPSADYIVSDIDDKAFISRFCQIGLHTSTSDWLEYARANGYDDAVTAFLEDQPGLLDGADAEHGLYSITPCRRSWSMVNRIASQNPDPQIAFELYQGLVGAEGAVAFQSFQATFERSISLTDVIDNYPKVQERVQNHASNGRLDVLSNVAKLVVEHTQKDDTEYTANQLENIVLFLLDLPMDLGFPTVRDLIEAGLDRDPLRDDKTVTNATYIDIGEDKRLIAHFEKADALYQKAQMEAQSKQVVAEDATTTTKKTKKTKAA